LVTVATISRWGNSVAVRIPRSVLEQSHLHEGDTVEVEAGSDGGIVLRPTRRKSLTELVAAITPENLHGETFADAPIGAERW
jgi:antitoxin MazE